MPVLHVGDRGRARLRRGAVAVAAVLQVVVLGGAAATPGGAQVGEPPSVGGLHRDALQRRVEDAVHGALLAEDGDARDGWLDTADALGEALVETYPASADAWYWRSVALGVRTEYAGPFQKLRTGPDVLDATVRTLELDSLHAGGHEMMGRLHAAVMRLPWPIRQLALRMGLGDALGDASWAEAERHYRVAVRQDPRAPAPRLELAKLLADRDRPAEAVPFLRELVALAPGTEVDRRIVEEGAALLETLAPTTPAP